ncbi:MAG: 50S ribosomal protein L10 [Parcubacteria group bacterium ADurb.Bin159]|jgi:large subunit ribosomal protein L10|nr:MAG: 50S ribosomal protein L10 [Parcubacteria group bacterium ADurb.Bin159]
MPKTRQEKENLIKNLSYDLNEAKIVVFTNHLGLNANELNSLRKILRENECKYQVVKKTLLKKVYQNKNIEEEIDKLEGGVGVIFSFGDEIKGPKAALKFSEEKAKFKINGGIWNKNYLTGNEILSLANLPSKKTLLSQVAGNISFPLKRLDYILKYNLQRLILVLESLSK